MRGGLPKREAKSEVDDYEPRWRARWAVRVDCTVRNYSLVPCAHRGIQTTVSLDSYRYRVDFLYSEKLAAAAAMIRCSVHGARWRATRYSLQGGVLHLQLRSGTRRAPTSSIRRRQARLRQRCSAPQTRLPAACTRIRRPRSSLAETAARPSGPPYPPSPAPR